MGWDDGVGMTMDIGEDIFAGSGIVGLNFDTISHETHSDIGWYNLPHEQALLAKVAHVSQPRQPEKLWVGSKLGTRSDKVPVTESQLSSIEK